MSDSPIKVTVTRLYERQFLNFIKKQPDIAKACMTAVAFSYAVYVRNTFLSGQVLNRITGRTFSSVKFFKEKKELVYGVRPGAGIKGRLNYLLKFERGNRSFMQPSAQAFRPSAIKIAIETYRTKRQKELGK